MHLTQLNTGIWSFQVQGAAPRSGFVWSRMVGTVRLETFASDTDGSIWLSGNTTFSPQTVPPFATRDDFLAWACTQLDAEKGLFWWELSCECTDQGTYGCKKVKTKALQPAD